jgi:hypothetical protein
MPIGRVPGAPASSAASPVVNIRNFQTPLLRGPSYEATNSHSIQDVNERINSILYPTRRVVASSSTTSTAASASEPILPSKDHVGAVPTEILVKILLLARPNVWVHRTENRACSLQAFVRLNLVYKHWYSAMAFNPVLWTLLPCLNDRQTWRMLQLSQNAPLQVSPVATSSIPLLKDILKSHSRISAFHFDWHKQSWAYSRHDEIATCLNDFLNQRPKPMLEVVELNGLGLGHSNFKWHEFCQTLENVCFLLGI